MNVQVKPKAGPADPDVVRMIAEVASGAEGMGLIEDLSFREARSDLALFEEVLAALAEAGVARGVLAEMKSVEGVDRQRLISYLKAIRQALDESPLPEHEWKALLRIFSPEDLMGLVNVSARSISRYSRLERQTPDEVADRLHLVALIVGDLKGAYNDVGIRRWFHRRRSALKDRTPAELLAGDWDPADPEPLAVRELARSLLYAAAT